MKIEENKWYDANNDIELVQKRLEIQDLCFQYNQKSPLLVNEKKILLEKILGYSVHDVEIISPFLCDYGQNILFGHHVFVNANSYFMDGAKIRVGNHVYIGPSCGFYTANHPMDIEKRNAGLEIACPITIEDDVWVGANVSIMPGVKIGQGSVIAAGSVVTKNIPSHVLAAGIPCTVKKEI